MQIDIFTACDFAQIISGRVILSGTFHDLYANNFPSKANFSVVVALSLLEEEVNKEHSIIIKCVSSSGGDLFEHKFIFVETKSFVNCVLNARDVPISQQGSYKLVFYWDGKKERTFSITAKIQ